MSDQDRFDIVQPNRGGRPIRGLSYNSSSDNQIRAIIHQIDVANEWPTPRKARGRGMRADNRRFTPIRDGMYEAGEIKTPPPKFIAWPAEKRREFLHSPGRVPEPEKPKADNAPRVPCWANAVLDDRRPPPERLLWTLEAFLAYRRAWRSLESFPVDFFRRIVPRKKRKRVKT